MSNELQLLNTLDIPEDFTPQPPDGPQCITPEPQVNEIELPPFDFAEYCTSMPLMCEIDCGIRDDVFSSLDNMTHVITTFRGRIQQSIERHEDFRLTELVLLEMTENESLQFEMLSKSIPAVILLLDDPDNCTGSGPKTLLDFSCQNRNQISFNEFFSKGARMVKFGLFLDFMYPKYQLIKFYFSYERNTKDIFQLLCEILSSLFRFDMSQLQPSDDLLT